MKQSRYKCYLSLSEPQASLGPDVANTTLQPVVCTDLCLNGAHTVNTSLLKMLTST